MPQPTRTDVHIDAPLTNISVAYIQDQSMYKAAQIFPVIPVDKLSNKYFKYTKNDWLKDEAKPRGDSQESAGSGYTLSTDSYQCTAYAIHKDIPDFVASNEDTPLNSDRDASLFVTERILQRIEQQVVSDYFTTGIWGTDLTGVASSPSATQFVQWSDYTASDPRDNIDYGRELIKSVTPFAPNTLVIGFQAFRKLLRHPDVVDQFKYTSAESVSVEMLAQFFGLDRIIVCDSILATNKEGQTGAYQFSFGKAALLCYVAPNPGILTASAGYIFAWKGVSEGLSQTVGIRKIPMPHLRSTRIEGEVAFGSKVVSSDLGVFFATAVA